MNVKKKVLLFALVILGVSGAVLAATDTATQTVTVTFDEIATVEVSGDPATLTLSEPASAGDLPADATDSSTTMSWTCNVDAGNTRKITGQIDGLFSGVNLYGTVADDGSNGTSAGETQFAAATTDYDFITGITDENVSANTITFKAEVSSMTAPYSDTTQTVTWTLTEDS